MISNVRANLPRHQKPPGGQNHLNAIKLFVNINNVNLFDCVLIYKTLMETKDLNHIVNKDIAKLISEYSANSKFECLECCWEYIMTDSDEWNA